MLNHKAQRALHPQFSDNNKLYVITPIVNPKRYESRYRLFEEFAEYVEKTANTVLVPIEMAFGDRDFALTHPGTVQVRGSDELWQKENLINLAVGRLPYDWKYMAWVDGDIKFTRDDWAIETLHLLQHFSIVQMFSHATDLGPQQEPVQHHVGLVHTIEQYASTGQDIFAVKNKDTYSGYFGHPGYAWAFRREAYDGLGGMLDTGVAGAGDHHMALALYGHANRSLPVSLSHPYSHPVLLWQERALRAVKQNVGHMPGTLLHYWHGKKADRRYGERWSIIRDNHFDPSRDLVRDSQGLYKLSGVKPKLRDDLRRYFSARNEDSIDR